MKYPKLRELREAVKSLFSKPYTIKYPAEPSVPPARFRGKPEFTDKCIGCGACFETCPAGAIQLTDSLNPDGGTERGPFRRLVLQYDHCIYCGQCRANCPTQEGVKYTHEYELALFDRQHACVSIEKDLLLCEVCGAVISTLDHVRWLAEKLGPLAYANMGLVLAGQRELSPLGEVTPKDRAQIGRADHVKFLCPKCQHQVFVKEDYPDRTA
ncbi:MAG: 4Fe-4S binding protein [bacterium]|nr:4Fe-4S binding protein [bacterium]